LFGRRDSNAWVSTDQSPRLAALWASTSFRVPSFLLVTLFS